jgi:glycosyltransferase involved in cell wall biosynthesis
LQSAPLRDGSIADARTVGPEENGLAFGAPAKGESRPDLISVLLPVYNAIVPRAGDGWLRQTIDSVLGQCDVDFELVIVNDGSVDDTDLVLQSYTNDPRVSIVTLQRNRGYSMALNLGAEVAKGSLLARMLTGDYYVTTLALRKLADALDSGRYDIVGANGTSIESNGNSFVPLHYPMSATDILRRLPQDCPMLPGSMLIRRTSWRLLEGYSLDPKYRFSEDYEFLVRAALHPSHLRLYNVQEPLYARRMHDGRSSTSPLTRDLHLQSAQRVKEAFAEYTERRTPARADGQSR